MKLVCFACLLLLGCNLLPVDTTAERESMQREHERAVVAKQAEAQPVGFPPEEQLLLAQQRAQIQQGQDEHAALLARVQKESKLKSDLAAWRRDQASECARAMNYSTCVLPPEGATVGDNASCYATCEDSINEALKKMLQAALAECAGASGAPVCRIAIPKTATRRNGSPLQPEAIAATSDLCAKECVTMRAQLAVDAVERPKAASTGESLVLSYKRCMLAVDSTHQAITYRIHDADLYQDLLAKADARCRAASRCDWVEKYSDDWRCSYGNN